MSYSHSPFEQRGTAVLGDDPARLELAEFLATNEPRDIDVYCGAGFRYALDGITAGLKRTTGLSNIGQEKFSKPIEKTRLSVTDSRLQIGMGVMSIITRSAYISSEKPASETQEQILISPQLLLKVCNALLEAEEQLSPEPDMFGDMMVDAANVCGTIGLWDKVATDYASEWSDTKRRTFASYMGLKAAQGCLESRFDQYIEDDDTRPGSIEAATEMFISRLAPKRRTPAIPAQLWQAFRGAINKEDDQNAAYEELAHTVHETVEPAKVVPLDERRRKKRKLPPIIGEATITELPLPKS